MSGGASLIAGTCETALLYSLVACGFYFASSATRHFCFVAAVCFVIAPFGTSLATSDAVRVFAALASLGVCAVLGMIYKCLTASLSARGAREGQLLILSLATLSAAENALTIPFGSASRTLWYAQERLSFFGTTLPQMFVIALASATVIVVLIVWYRSLIGTVMRALVESRLNLSLSGFPVSAIESWTTIFGFVCVGLAGLFWSLDGRVKPSMCTEVAIIGAVAFIVGTMTDIGLFGFILAATTLAVLRTFLSLSFEGDWSMTAMLLLLCATALVSRRRLRGRGNL